MGIKEEKRIDLSLIAVNSEENILSFSGVNQMICIAREGKIYSVKGKDENSFFSESKEIFDEISIQSKKEDIVYLFTDETYQHIEHLFPQEEEESGMKYFLNEICGMPIELQRDQIIQDIDTKEKEISTENSIQDKILIMGIRYL